MPATSRPSCRKCNRARPTARATPATPPATPPALSARRPISPRPLRGNRASQPISINASQPVNLDAGSCDTSPVLAMAETFESQLMGTQAVRPTNPSVIAGAATAEVASVSAADDAGTVFGDAHLQDNFDGINWSRLPRFMIPPTTPRSRRSWIYRHGYRVALISDPSRIFFICYYCHARKIIDCGGSGAFETTLSTSCSARHLEARKAGHGHRAPGRPAHFRQQDSYLRRAFNAANGSLSQATANSLSGFNTQRFRLAAVRWLVENNHPLREFETPAFQQLIAAANPDAERALWASRTSVSSFVMRLYDHMLPRVVVDLSESMSKIHISFDGWTTKGGKQGYLGIVAHYVNPCGELKDLPIALPQLMGDHSEEAVNLTMRKTHLTMLSEAARA